MKTIEKIMESKRVLIAGKSKDGFCGEIHMPMWRGTIVCSVGAGWEHVSVAPSRRNLTPSWDDMCIVKDIFWNDDEAVIQIHPPKSEYVNNLGNCLHLWRCYYKEMVLPPRVLVGVTDGMTPQELREEIKTAYEMAGEEI